MTWRLIFINEGLKLGFFPTTLKPNYPVSTNLSSSWTPWQIFPSLTLSQSPSLCLEVPPYYPAVCYIDHRVFLLISQKVPEAGEEGQRHITQYKTTLQQVWAPVEGGGTQTGST